MMKGKFAQEHVRENGDAGGFTIARREHDIDIKLLQQKKQQAEIRRYGPDTIHC